MRSNKKWFGNQLQDAIEKVGRKKLNLDLHCRALLIALGKYAYSDGTSFPLKSQLEDASGIPAYNMHRHFKILEQRKFITVQRKYNKVRRMTKNTYQIHLDIILELALDDKGAPKVDKIRVNQECSHIEPNVTVTCRSNIEPNVTVTPIKPTQLKQDLNQEPTQKNQEHTVASRTAQEMINNSISRGIVQDGALHEKIVSIGLDKFDEFWAVYPRKEHKKRCRQIWNRQHLEFMADKIITDVLERRSRHDRWQNREYIPMPSTYLHGEYWNDEIIDSQNDEQKNNSIPKSGNLRSYSEQLKRAATKLNDRYVRTSQNNMGGKVD